MQDGETLPAGPVVISPDGLFPSLYREGDIRHVSSIAVCLCGNNLGVLHAAQRIFPLYTSSVGTKTLCSFTILNPAWR